MATKNSPPALDADTVNNEAVTVMAKSDINAAQVTVIASAAQQSMPAAPDNTPVPGGGRWAWDYSLACWVDLDAPATPATNLIQPE
jgi:hypothetical protein